jgi:hypothetical protein
MNRERHWDGQEDEKFDDARQRLDEEREMMINAALDDDRDKGVTEEHLRTLARECGATLWALHNSFPKEDWR